MIFPVNHENIISIGGFIHPHYRVQMEKTVRLFVLNKKEIRMSFHFMHPIDLEIKNFGFAIQGDAGKFVGGEMQVDSRVSIR